MLLRPIFPMSPPPIDKTCKIYMFRGCCQEGGKLTLLLFHDYFSSDWQVSTWTVSPDMLCFTWHLSSHSFITLPQPSLVIGNTALEKLCCSSTWVFNTSITLQSASTSNFSHSKQSIIFPYCPLKYVSATTSKKVKVLVILLICLSHWKCYSCSNRDDDFEELSLLNIFQAIKHLQRPVNGIFLKIELQIPLKLSFHNH